MKRASTLLGPTVLWVMAGTVSAQTLPAVGPMSWVYGYDAVGRLTTTLDPFLASTDVVYDTLGRPSKITQPVPASGLVRPVIGQDWDGLDQLKTVTDPRLLATSYVRSGLGDTTSWVSPDTGTTSATYDAAGNRLSRTDARGKTTTYSYDALNRLYRVVYPTGTGSGFIWDGGTTLPKPPNSLGRLTSLSDESGSTTYSYDVLGRIKTKSQVLNASLSRTFIVQYGWGVPSSMAAAKLENLTYPSGARLNWIYDATGRVSGVTVNAVNTNGVGTSATVLPLLSNMAYTAWNEPASWTWASGATYARTWDSYARPKTYPLGNPAGTGLAAGMTRTVGYDDTGRINAYTHTRGTTALNSYDQGFSYDGLSRLINTWQGTTSYGYDYDASGNRKTLTVSGMAYSDQVSPSSNRLSSVQKLSSTGSTSTEVQGYDAAGNLLSSGTSVTAVYSGRGRVSTTTVPAGTTTSTTTYRFNALEQRAFKIGTLVNSGVAFYVYDEADHLLGEYDVNGSPLYEVIWLGDLPLGVMKQTKTGNLVSTRLDDIYADHLNAPRVITRGSDQAILWRWESTEPFGATPANDNPSALGTYPFNLRLPGQVFDKETGWAYNHHRDYDPYLGRYIQSDPIGLKGGINTYGYVAGNPISKTDPLGLIDGWTDHSGPPDMLPRPSINIVHGSPENACTCSSGGKNFSAPPGTNYNDVFAAGQNGGYNPFAADSAIGHFGTYDFQRNYMNNTFTGAYTDASNFSVGVYMRGAGFGREQTFAIGSAFARTMSKNAGAAAMADYWNAGWDAANSGNLGVCK